MNTDKPKTKIEESLDGLLQNRVVKVGCIIVLCVGGLFLASKAFNVIGGAVSSFKGMVSTFKG